MSLPLVQTLAALTAADLPSTWRNSLRTHRAAAVMLAAATLTLCFATRTTAMSHSDEVQYALGMHDFNVLLHHPHPPGSPFFVLLGQIGLIFTGDEHRAFLLVGALAAAGAIITVYHYTAILFGRPAAWLAATTLMTHPIFWSYGSSGSAWTVLALLGSVTGFLCLLLQRGARWLVFPSAVVIGLASGFRMDVTVFLGPLWVWSVCRVESRWRRRVLAILCALTCVALWLVPVAVMTGGLQSWTRSYVAMFFPNSTLESDRLRELVTSTLIEWGITLVTVGPLVLLGLVVNGKVLTNYLRTPCARHMLVFTGVWAVPSFLFLWFVDATEAGHNLLYLVGLYPLAAGLAARCALSRRHLVGAGAILVALQVVAFLYGQPTAGQPLAYTQNMVMLGFTRRALQRHDVGVREFVAAVQRQYDPRDTVMITFSEQSAYRYAMYYLPEFEVLRVPPPGQSRGVMSARNQRHTWRPLSDCLLGPDVRRSVWVVDVARDSARVPDGAVIVHEGSMYRVLELPVPFEAAESHGYWMGGCTEPQVEPGERVISPHTASMAHIVESYE